MNTNSFTAQKVVSKDSPLSPLAKILLIFCGGVALFLLLLSGTGIGYEYYYHGQIFPGVSVAGVDLSGMDPVAAAVKLSQWVTYPQSGRIVFQDNSQVWNATPAELGVSLDLEATIEAAYSLGRRGNPLQRVIDQIGVWRGGKDLPPVFQYDERIAYAFLSKIAAQVDRPVQEASLSLTGVEVIETPGQIGRQLDIPTLLEPLEIRLRSLTDGLIPLVVVETAPKILDSKSTAEQARKILSESLVLTLPDAQENDPGPWKVEPKLLAEMMVFKRLETLQGGTYELDLDIQKLLPVLADTAPRLLRSSSNAKFIFNDETRRLDLIEPSVIGRSLDIDATLEAVRTELLLGNHNLPVTLNLEKPEVSSDTTAEQLGIRELVSQHTSFFYGSSAPRIQNIQTAAARFHGVLVPPGAVFSMAEALGDVSLDNGYEEALIIIGDRTIKGVGGGVCQVSTTLFRTVFFGGYPIEERHSHAYRVGYYEQTAGGQINPDLAGLDATVFVPLVDFRFKNDSNNWLLMETYVNVRAKSLTWKFYSTSDGRTVEWKTSGLENIVDPPPPQYIENPELGAGETHQVDWEVEGADVTVNRVVYRGGEVYFRDRYITHYQPWRSIIEYGPGTDIPSNGN